MDEWRRFKVAILRQTRRIKQSYTEIAMRKSLSILNFESEGINNEH